MGENKNRNPDDYTTIQIRKTVHAVIKRFTQEKNYWLATFYEKSAVEKMEQIQQEDLKKKNKKKKL